MPVSYRCAPPRTPHRPLPGVPQVDLYCISRLLNHMLDTDEEFVYLDAQCPIGWPVLPLGIYGLFLNEIWKSLGIYGLVCLWVYMENHEAVATVVCCGKQEIAKSSIPAPMTHIGGGGVTGIH